MIKELMRVTFIVLGMAIFDGPGPYMVRFEAYSRPASGFANWGA